jgi:hypothetical protein
MKHSITYTATCIMGFGKNERFHENQSIDFGKYKRFRQNQSIDFDNSYFVQLLINYFKNVKVISTYRSQARHSRSEFCRDTQNGVTVKCYRLNNRCL